MKPSTSTSATATPYAKYLNGRAGHRRDVPAQPLGLVEAGRPELDALVVGRPDELVPRRGRGARRAPAPSRASDLVAGVLDRAAVEVGAGAGRGGRGVGHLVGAGRREPDLLQRQPERGRGDLEHLGVQALAHLGAAVVDQHRAVLVDVHQRAGLVEGREVERDAELHRRDRQPRLACGCSSLNAVDLRPTARRRRSVAVTWSQASAMPLGVADRLAVRRGLARRRRSCGGAARRARSRAAARSDR